MVPAPVGALVLAAGLGRRFGGAKLLALWRGRPIVSYVFDVLAECRSRSVLTAGIVVHRPDDFDTARMASERGLEPHRNSRPGSGMASSLRLGLTALSAERWQPLDGALVVMGDQPLLRPEVIETLVSAFEPAMDIVRPQYADDPEGPGHPVIVHRRLWDRARGLTGDEGFRVIATWKDVRVAAIPVSGSNPDVDTPDDLARLGGQEGPRGA